MAPKTAISENQVLVATALWLRSRGVLPVQISVASGQGIDTGAAKDQVRTALLAAGIPPPLIRFASDGPDFVGVSAKEWWQLECKGAGVGVQATQRNNFDRALASVVSYYLDKTPDLGPGLAAVQGAVPHLGLALPATPDYLRELRRRVGRDLRRRLNLWVLLYEPASTEIRAVEPDSDI